VAEPRSPTSRHGLSRESSLLGYDPRAGVLDMPAEQPAPAEPPAELDDMRASRRSVWFG
jgi:hypothetical protein